MLNAGVLKGWASLCSVVTPWVAILGVLFPGLAYTQSYPLRAVTIVVPFATDVVTDVNTRVLAQFLQSGVGKPFVVENKPGANGMIGAASVVNARPDGYTLLIGGNTTHSIVRNTFKTVPYDLIKSSTPIAKLFDRSA